MRWFIIGTVALAVMAALACGAYVAMSYVMPDVHAVNEQEKAESDAELFCVGAVNPRTLYDEEYLNCVRIETERNLP